MKKAFTLLAKIFVGIALGLVLLPHFAPVQAASLQDGILNQTKEAAKGSFRTTESDDPQQILMDRISRGLNLAIGFLGVAGVLLIIYAGFLWLTAGGDSGKIGTAKEIIQRVVLGGLVLFLAYAIATWGISLIQDRNQPQLDVDTEVTPLDGPF